MFPSTFVDGGENGNEFIVMAPFVNEMKKRTNKSNADNAQIHHAYILAQKNGRADRNRTCIADLEGLGPIR